MHPKHRRLTQSLNAGRKATWMNSSVAVHVILFHSQSPSNTEYLMVLLILITGRLDSRMSAIFIYFINEQIFMIKQICDQHMHWVGSFAVVIDNFWQLLTNLGEFFITVIKKICIINDAIKQTWIIHLQKPHRTRDTESLPRFKQYIILWQRKCEKCTSNRPSQTPLILPRRDRLTGLIQIQRLKSNSEVFRDSSDHIWKATAILFSGFTPKSNVCFLFSPVFP